MLDGEIPQTPLVNKFLKLQVNSQKKVKKNEGPNLNLVNKFNQESES